MVAFDKRTIVKVSLILSKLTYNLTIVSLHRLPNIFLSTFSLSDKGKLIVDENCDKSEKKILILAKLYWMQVTIESDKWTDIIKHWIALMH